MWPNISLSYSYHLPHDLPDVKLWIVPIDLDAWHMSHPYHTHHHRWHTTCRMQEIINNLQNSGIIVSKNCSMKN
ncbi:hypothetical protein DPMN_017333 [Dreissena polymorpha]|uniref:Uncharacterized protein n=1 Tax=Dreissena polymorpha TaxID=45954 RepID=A0A9D4S5C1_DREPO|nr:hypothetical protein DPMN_017333 [Dreissena polymorpha]